MSPTDPPGSPVKPQSKLFVRSEVMSVIHHLLANADLSKQERAKQIKRIRAIEAQDVVQEILIKELSRSPSGDTLHVIVELLMEIGHIDMLSDKLWDVIRDPNTTDEVKDAANLILRHLGDNSDPDLYLEYLDDPQGLIARETSRMLEVSSENPETLIDFVDFILSLNPEDQVRLVASLQRDYPSDHLVNLFVPLLESDPNPGLWEQLVVNLGETKSPRAAQSLQWLTQWPEERLPVPLKLVQKSLKQLQLAGALRETDSTAADAEAIIKGTTPFRSYATLYDGIGNQGLLFSRQRANADIALLCVAINDTHGIMDCFGFYQLSEGDFQRIAEKFHEGATKIDVPPEYVARKLNQALELNRSLCHRIPYEFQCWLPLLSDITPASSTESVLDDEWIKASWEDETYNLYQHPDFNSWFLEPGDEPIVTTVLNDVLASLQIVLESNQELDKVTLFAELDAHAMHLARKLMEDEGWRNRFINRLSDSAYLLDCQQTNTFRSLAATEAHKLIHLKPEDELKGFILAYGRRCVLEELLRYRTGSVHYDKLSPIVDDLVTYWGL